MSNAVARKKPLANVASRSTLSVLDVVGLCALSVAPVLATRLAHAEPAPTRTTASAGSGVGLAGLDAVVVGKKTVITVHGNATPSFSAYRLEQPARLVVDLAGGITDGQGDEKSGRGSASTLDSKGGPIDVDTWAVGQISIARGDATGAQTARLLIGLKRSSRYDVKARGTDLVITIIPDEAPPSGSAVEQARTDEAKAAQATAQAAALLASKEARQAKAERVVEEGRRKDAEEARASAQAELARLEKQGADAKQAAQAARENAKVAEASERSRLEAAQRSRSEDERRTVEERQAEAARLQAMRVEAERIARDRRAEEQRLEAARAEAERLTRTRQSEERRLEEVRAEERRLEAARAAEQRQQEARVDEHRKAVATEEQRLAQTRGETERLAQVRAIEEQRLAAARDEIRRIEAARDEEQRQETVRIAERRKETVLAEQARADQARSDETRVLALRTEEQRLEAAHAEDKRIQAARSARERVEAQQLETERRAIARAAEGQRAQDRADEQHREALRAQDEKLAAARDEIRRLRATEDAVSVTTLATSATSATTATTATTSTKSDDQKPRAAMTPAATTATTAVTTAEAPPARHAPAVDARTAAARAYAHAHARVLSVDFQDEEQVSRIVIGVTDDPEYAVLQSAPKPGGISIGERTAVLQIRSIELPQRLARTLDTSAFGGPVASVSTYADPEDPAAVRVVVKLAAAVYAEVRREKGRIVWNFPKSQVRRGVESFAPQRVAGFGLSTVPLQLANVPLQIGEPPTSPVPIGQRPSRPTTVGGTHHHFVGTHIDLDFKDADIHNILRLLADVGQINIVTSDDVKGTITIRMRDTPWDQALDVILRTKGLGQVRDGNLIRVAPQQVLEKEQEAEIARQKVAVELKPLSTRLIPLSYASAEKLMPRVQDLLSPRGKVSFDERTNMLIVSDISGNLSLAEDLIRNLDTQTPQVLIEARIIEATSSFSRDVGIQWGTNGISSAGTGNPTGLAFPNTIGVGGGATDATSQTAGLLNGQAASPNYVVNLPAAVGSGTGGALGLTLGAIGGNFNVNLRLSAAEATGTIRILSSPKVMTLDNVEASIEQGTSIPISVVSAAGVNTVFIDAKLNLTVKPHVTNEGSVTMTVAVSRNEPNTALTSSNGIPSILKRQAKTEMLVRDGDTAVIGGIYTRNTSTSYSKIPWLGDIPILGWLFKQRKDSDNRSELLIFITPRIVNRASSIAASK